VGKRGARRRPAVRGIRDYDQQSLGLALVMIAIATAALWLLHVATRRTGNDALFREP